MATASHVDHVAILNKSAVPDGEVARIVEAYRAWLKTFCDVWKLPVPGIALYPAAHKQIIEEEAGLILVDSGNDPDAFGWHTALGLAVWSYVDVGLCRAYDEPVSRVLGHELLELVLDPDCEEWEPRPGTYPDGTQVAKEACDAVQRFSRRVTVDDPILGKGEVELADFVLPSWFQPGSPGPWSYLDAAPGPLKDAAGGYHTTELRGVVMAEGAQVRVKNFGRTFRRIAAAA
jgi:hypothetical protein